jgi:hypothetical protein
LGVFYYYRRLESLQIAAIGMDEIGRRRINCAPLSALLRAGSFAFSGLGMAPEIATVRKRRVGVTSFGREEK